MLAHSAENPTPVSSFCAHVQLTTIDTVVYDLISTRSYYSFISSSTMFVGIFNKCSFGKAIKNGQFNIPRPQVIPSKSSIAPFVIVGDQAFPLLINLMRPFPEKQSLSDKRKEEFNYRLSRARRVSENAFGISTNLFPIFSKPFDIRCGSTRNNLIISACLLHNLIRDESEDFFLSHQSNTSVINSVQEIQSQSDFNSIDNDNENIGTELNLELI